MKRSLTTPVVLLCNSAKDYSIVDGKNRSVSIEEARQLWESGAVQDYNLAMLRLAGMNFNVEALKAYYGGRNCA